MNTTAAKQPSIPQMLNRALSGHERYLRAVAEGRPVLGPTASASEMRGMMKVASTLRRWGCVDGDALTERGAALLDAYHAKFGATR